MSQTKEQLKDYVVERVEFAVECGICSTIYGSEEEVMGERPKVEAFLDEIHEMGWRELDSEEYGSILIACPHCVEEQIPSPKARLTEGI